MNVVVNVLRIVWRTFCQKNTAKWKALRRKYFKYVWTINYMFADFIDVILFSSKLFKNEWQKEIHTEHTVHAAWHDFDSEYLCSALEPVRPPQQHCWRLIFRSTPRLSWLNNAGCPSVHKKFFSGLPDLNEIWCSGRGRWVLHDHMTRSKVKAKVKVTGPSKLEILPFLKSICCYIYNGSRQMTSDS